MAHDVFISYQQADKAIADAVCHRMEAAGVRCWIAPRDITHGKPWDDAVVDALTAAKVLVLIFSAAANASRDVVNEVKTALDAGATVMPFRIEDIRPTGGLGLHLGRVHWLDALTPPREAAIDQLIESVKRNLPAARDTEVERAVGARRKAEDERRKGQEERAAVEARRKAGWMNAIWGGLVRLPFSRPASGWTMNAIYGELVREIGSFVVITALLGVIMVVIIVVFAAVAIKFHL